MKNTLLSVAAIAAVVTTASADTAWFNGTIGSEAGGAWTMPADGVTTNSTTLVLDDPSTAAYFTASEKKSLSSAENLSFTTTAKFEYAYDELPEIDANERAGVIVYGTTYYVLEKDGSTNWWSNSGITAALDSDVTVNVVISNGNSSAWAFYTIGGSSVTKEIVQPSAAMGVVSYSGCGEISSLIGQLISMGIFVPGYDTPIPQNATVEAWLEANDMTVAQLRANETQENGNNAYENCVLGLDNDETLTTTAADTSASKITYNINSTPLSGMGVAYKLMKQGQDAAVASGESPSFEQDIADGVYYVTAQIGNDVVTSKKIGAMQVDSVQGTEYIAVPWTAEDGTGIAPTALVKASGLTEDDQLLVYDVANNDWEGYRWTGSAWTPTDGTKHVTSLAYGTAVKLIRNTPANKVWLVGTAGETSAPTALTSGKWNLVANPAFGEYTIGSAKLGTSSDDAVYVPDGDTFKLYTCRKGSWAKLTTTVTDGIQTNTRVTDDMTVPQGVGFFFENGSSKTNIQW